MLKFLYRECEKLEVSNMDDKEKKETLSNIKSFGSKIIETMDFDSLSKVAQKLALDFVG